MQGDPSQKLGQALAGPSPNPQAPPAASPDGGPGTIPPNATAQAPSPSYAPDQGNSQLISQLLQVHQQNLQSNDLNRNLAMMASGFGTAQQQQSKVAALSSMPTGDDTLSSIGQIMKIQQEKQAFDDQQKFKAGSGLLGQAFGLSPQVSSVLANDPDTFKMVIGKKLQDMSLSDQEKIIRDWEASARASGMSDQDIQTQKTTLLGGMIGSQDPISKQMRQDSAAWDANKANAGKPKPSYLSNLVEYAAQKAEEQKMAVGAGVEKDNAKLSMPAAEQAWTGLKTTLDQLGQDPDAMVKAIQSGGYGTEGTTGAINKLTGVGGLAGYGQNVINAKALVDQLQAQLQASAVQGVKNVRTQREFTSYGAAASPMFKSLNSREQILKAYNDVVEKYGLGHANAIAEAGGVVPFEYKDKVDPEFLDTGSRFYNGATVEQPPAKTSASGGGKALTGDDLAQAKTLIARDGRDAVIAHLKAKGYDTSGL
jgi:hypothetical protein